MGFCELDKSDRPQKKRERLENIINDLLLGMNRLTTIFVLLTTSLCFSSIPGSYNNNGQGNTEASQIELDSFVKNNHVISVYVENMTTATGITINGSKGILTGLGDVNNDGYGDLALGWRYQAAAQGAGTAYLMYSPQLNLQNIQLPARSVELKGANIVTASSITQGVDVAMLGDFNGDGCNDIAVSVPWAQSADNSRSASGRVFVLYGCKQLGSSIDLQTTDLVATGLGFRIYGPLISWVGIGFAIAGNGNFDATGQGLYNGHDLLISGDGLNCNSNADRCAGVTYLILGKSGRGNINVESLSNNGITIYGETYGYCSYAGTRTFVDITGDGFAEIIIGAPCLDSAGNSESGVVYIIRGQSVASLTFPYNMYLAGSSPSSPLKTYRIYGEAVGDRIGVSVANAGDINNDGKNDLIIGTVCPTISNRPHAGKVYLLFGTSTLSDISLSSLTPNQGIRIYGASQLCLGVSVTGLGDFNGDGIHDFAVSASGGWVTPIRTSVFVFYGKSGPFADMDILSFSQENGIVIYSKYGAYIGEDWGRGVNPAGDYNGDGLNDLAITGKQESYVIFGNREFSITPTASPTLSPTRSPTASPTPSPTRSPSFFPSRSPSPLPTLSSENTSNKAQASSETSQFWFKIVISFGSTLAGLIFGWLFRSKIAFYILENWGHSVILFSSKPKRALETAELAIFLIDDEISFQCGWKTEESLGIIVVDNGINSGISRGLYDLLVEKFRQPELEFSLTILEKTQILTFLRACRYIETASFLGIQYYPELGFLKGMIYSLCFQSYQAEFLEHIKTKHTPRVKSFSNKVVVPIFDSQEL